MEDYEFSFESVVENGKTRRRIGKSKSTGLNCVELKFDENGREIEKIFYDDDGNLSKRAVYEHDQERRPLLTTVFDKDGKLLMRHERGKRPEIFE